MTRHRLTAVRVQFKDGGATLTAQTRSPRGTTYRTGAPVEVRRGASREERKERLIQALVDLGAS